ncbi:MAG: DUF3857 domain-containing transglutaminase family protein [Armatimonadota bacterium]
MLRWVWLVLALAICGMASAEAIADQDILALLNNLPIAKDYPGTDAVWLRRDFDVTVNADGTVKVYEHKFITILTEQGLALANWEIPYDTVLESLEVRTARTLLNGQAFPVNPAHIGESSAYPGVAWYDSLTIRRFPLPTAAVGATFEIETVFTKRTPRVPGHFCTRLSMQQEYPMREANYTIRIPAAQQLHIRFTDPHHAPAQETSKNGQRIYRWTERQVPGMRITEPQTPPVADLVLSARMTTMENWAPVAAWYAAITADKAAITPDIRRIAEQRTAECATREAKIAVLHKAVREMPYVGIEMGELSDVPHTADEVLRQNYGDCKDKATLLRALLRVVDIDSDYVLVRTVDAGVLDRKLYGPDEFNHVILAVKTPGGDQFLDATIPDVPTGSLPPNVEGADGLIVRGTGELVTLPMSTAQQNRTEFNVVATVKADGSATGRMTMTFHGQTAIAQRSMLAPVPKEQYKAALEGTLATRLGSDIAIDTVVVAHLREPAQPLVLTADFSSPAYLQPAGPQWSGRLPVFTYQPNRFFSTKERSYPFVQYLDSSLHVDVSITLPTEYEVTALPTPVKYASQIGSYADTADVKDGVIRYTCAMTNHRGTFSPQSLADIRAWSGILALEKRNNLQFFLRRP